MDNYKKQKTKARQIAIEWQCNDSHNLSMVEYMMATSRFYKLGKRYGLLREFRENGIPV